MKVFFALLLVFTAIFLLIVASPIAIFFGLIRERKNIYMYFKKIAITLDQVGGAVLYGTEDWTISSYTHLLARYGQHFEAVIFEKVIDFFALPFQKKHCWSAYEKERIELRKKRGER